MITQPIPTYDLQGNRVNLPAFSPPIRSQKNMPDRKALTDIMKMFTDAIQEEDKNREETLSELKAEIAQLSQVIGDLNYSVFEKGMKEITQTVAEKHQEMTKIMEIEKEMKIKKEAVETKRHNEIMGMLEIIAQNNNASLEKLVVGLYDAIQNLTAPQVVLPEPIKDVKKEEPPNLMRPASGKRIKIKWVVATSPNLAGTESIIGAIDGVNKDFYVSGSPIKNSEQIRLNQGSPLSYGEDYTNTANKYSFTVAPPTGSKLEIKWQSR